MSTVLITHITLKIAVCKAKKSIIFNHNLWGSVLHWRSWNGTKMLSGHRFNNHVFNKTLSRSHGTQRNTKKHVLKSNDERIDHGERPSLQYTTKPEAFILGVQIKKTCIQSNPSRRPSSYHVSLNHLWIQNHMFRSWFEYISVLTNFVDPQYFSILSVTHNKIRQGDLALHRFLLGLAVDAFKIKGFTLVKLWIWQWFQEDPTALVRTRMAVARGSFRPAYYVHPASFGKHHTKTSRRPGNRLGRDCDVFLWLWQHTWRCGFAQNLKFGSLFFDVFLVRS